MTYTKGQSELISVVAFVGLALVIGVAMLSYFSSVISGYRSQAELSDHLQSESQNIHLDIISFDATTSTLWIILKRLDGSRSSYFIAVDTGAQYLGCSNISMYNPYNDNDGILCNSPNECITSQRVYEGSMTNVYTVWEGAISDFLSYSRAMGYTMGTIRICRIENVCTYSQRPGICDENTIARLRLSSGTTLARIFVVTLYNNVPYIVGLHEVHLR